MFAQFVLKRIANCYSLFLLRSAALQKPFLTPIFSKICECAALMKETNILAVQPPLFVLWQPSLTALAIFPPASARLARAESPRGSDLMMQVGCPTFWARRVSAQYSLPRLVR